MENEEHEFSEQEIEEQEFLEEEIEEPAPKRTRGLVKKIKDNVPKVIEFNDLGQPIGDKFVTFSNQVGLITRNIVPITYEDWRLVPDDKKDLVWSQVKDLYEIENDDAKKQMLNQCSSAWKRWKTKLRAEFMDMGLSPCKIYSSIEEKDWKEFVEKENTPDKREQRQKGRQNALKKKLPPRLGPKGYRGWEEAWKEEARTNPLLTDAHRIYDPRSRRWVMARLVKDEDNVKYVPVELSPYLDELLQLDSQMREGSWEPERGSDLLISVIGAEHSGYVRTVGPIGLRKGLKNVKETKKRTTVKDMRQFQDEIVANMNSMKNDFDTKLEAISNHIGVTAMEAAFSPGMRRSSCGSAMMSDPFEALEIPTKCNLLVPNIDRYIVCANGMVYPSGGSVVLHGQPIREGYMKVLVDHVEKKYTTLDIPVSNPNADIYELIQARATFIQWPKKAIQIDTAHSEIPTPLDSRETLSDSRKEKTLKALSSKKSFERAHTHRSAPSEIPTPLDSRESPLDSRKEKALKAISSKKSSEIARTPISARSEIPTTKKLPSNTRKEALSNTRKEALKVSTSKTLCQNVSTPPSVQISRLEKMKEVGGILATRPKVVKTFYNRWMQRADPTSGATFDIDGLIFGKNEVFHVPLVADEVIRFLTKKDLDVSILTLYCTILHEEMIVHPKGNRCAFLNPFLVDAQSCLDNPKGVESYLKEATERGRDIDVFLLPYHERSHWSLFVFLKNEYRGFILDSTMRSKNWKDFAITHIINRCSEDFNWEMAKVQQQSSTWESGYYVMRWMYEFVLLQQHSFPSTIPWLRKQPYDPNVCDFVVGMFSNGFVIPT